MSRVATKLLTAEEFVAKFSGDHVELVDGEVRELTMPHAAHGYINNLLAYYLTQHVRTHDCGRVMTNDTFVLTRRNPDRLRGADICYWSFERLPRGSMPEGLISAPPELVVEVRSPSDRWGVVLEKLGEYLEAGVDVVTLVEPRLQSATVYRQDENNQVVHNGDELTFPDVLPGFGIVISKLFE